MLQYGVVHYQGVKAGIFFESTVTDEAYLQMLEKRIIPALENLFYDKLSISY